MYAAVFPLVRTRAFTAPFDYLVPTEFERSLTIGSLVAVPLGHQDVLGVVVGISATSAHSGTLLPLRALVDLPPLPSDLVALAARLRDYYVSSLGSALALVAPAAASLRLEREVELTTAGARALEEGDPAVAPFARSTVWTAGRTWAAAERLREGGLLRVVYRLHVTQPGREPRLLARGERTPKRLGPRQRAALTVLEAGGVCDEHFLVRESGITPAALASMIGSGAVRIVEQAERESIVATPVATPVLLPEQEAALARVVDAMGRGREVLLHGVTGSGKTEVYLRAAAVALQRGLSVLMLVPEIGLTGQTVERLSARFPGERLAVLHSGLSAGERLAAFRDTASGRARIVIGARSAVFAPLRDVGLIVVDEEHDTSYKQDNEPRYDARTVARWRCQLSGAALVWGSATPSVETWARVADHADLPRRVDGSQPPRLEIVDLRDVHTVLCEQLRGALVSAVEAGEKVILFLNRRGVATSVSCAHCGRTWMCERCDLALTLFRRGAELRCRVCGRREPAPQMCPVCGSVDVGRHGVGTERLEAEVAALLPGVELLRLDSDVAASYARLRSVLDRFGAPGAKVLVGTQMIAKGHHFPEVTLVGVVNADLALFLPDFRAEERTFAMLLQVGGRSGRGARPGRVIVQTLNPEARSIALAAAGESERFYAEEVERRRQLGYPPATTLVAFELSSLDPATSARAGSFLIRTARTMLPDDEVMGPGPLWRERGRYICRAVVKSGQIGNTIDGVRRLAERLGPRFAARGVRLVVDVEPEWL
jgi:primosomal protein N' (replication factor Y)